MKRLPLSVWLMSWLVLWLPVGAGEAQQAVTLADFEEGLGAVVGDIELDSTVVYAGKASGRMDAKFSDKTRWITASLPMDLKNPITAFRFQARSQDVGRVTFRLIDATGQTLQTRLNFPADGAWHEVALESFSKWQHWGGDNDGQVHWPVGKISFILERVGGATEGTLWIDQFEATTEGQPRRAIDDWQKQPLAGFDDGLDGFNGQVTHDREIKHSGEGSARMETLGNSRWTTAQKELDLKHEIKQIRFWARTENASSVTIRLIDSTGQNLQTRPKLTPDGQWRQVVISSFHGWQHWGAPGNDNDGQIHWPVRKLAVILEKKAEDPPVTMWVDDIELLVDPALLVSKLEVEPVQLGQVFVPGEPVRLALLTQGEQVAWQVRDFWGKTVVDGVTPVRDKRAVIEPKVDRLGYFDVTLEAQQDGALLETGETSFAILPPFDVSKIDDSPFGVMTHFAQGWDPDVIPLIARGGIKNIRDELYWAHIEKQAGQFAFPQRFDTYMAAAKANHINPLIALTFGNPNYDHTPNAPGYGNAPYTDEGRAAYARYGERVLAHYGKQIRAVEIWNEYNGTFGKGPAAKDKPLYYFEMLKAAHETLKHARPDVTVVGVSAVAIPFPFFEDLFKRGALDYMDALSLHPYRTLGTPEGLDRQLLKLQELIKQYNDGQTMPLWITELGWYVKGPDARSDVVVTEADQAKYLVRSIALSLSAGVEKFYWYHLRDDAAFPSSGILHGPDSPKGRYTPKPAYAAYATLVRQLTGATFVEREMTLNEQTYAMRFERDGKQVRVLWSLEPVSLMAKVAGPLTVVDLMGGRLTIEPKGGEASLQLTDLPIYVWGEITGLPPVDPGVGRVIADAEEDFSSRQGDDGWSYGYFVASAPGGPYAAADWQPMPKYNVTIWGYEWLGDQPFLVLKPGNAHPSAEGGKPVWAVRRWASSVEGDIRINAAFSRPERGDGITARIFVDGREVWHQLVGGSEPSRTACELTVSVQEGSLVDFAIDPGPGADTSYDATSCRMTLRLLQ